MTRTLTLARTAAPAPSPSPANTTPPSVQPHVQAARLSLENALQALSGHLCTALDLQIATGRAIRAATMLKRACNALDADTTSKGA
ncbi:hypothetical protein [Malikia sp.]|uniref:hypothetical protein n=1 Tax=Malikia sp. TaxID=2070706 RepID=UPI00261C7442|nr:hypothetical protein [Malikia sp.]MDD2729303.1 hypothetical protein [Malikia sp.]